MTTVLEQPTSDANLGTDRRQREFAGGYTGLERRQFSDSRDELSPDAAQLAQAIDDYKLRHRRRFINFEEMLHVIKALGYSR
jgi:hypothetical protein